MLFLMENPMNMDDLGVPILKHFEHFWTIFHAGLGGPKTAAQQLADRSSKCPTAASVGLEQVQDGIGNMDSFQTKSQYS